MKRTLLPVLALAFGGMFLLNAQTPVQTTTNAPVIKVTLLGTGVPLLNPAAYVASGRVTAGLMVEAGTERMLWDCGQGIINRLLQSGGDPANPNIAVDKVFISHLHSDHYADLPALYSYGWFFRQNVVLNVWGPGPSSNGPFSISSIMPLLRLVNDSDINIRANLFKPYPAGDAFDPGGEVPTATELSEGVVYSHNGVTVTAFLVNHSPVTPAFGFRLDYQGHSVTFSGDTRMNDNLIKFATNTDVLMHEVYGFARETGSDIFDYHTPPEDAAKIFNRATPKLAVYTHLAIPPGTTDQDLIKRTRSSGYSGPLIASQDLMVINVMATGDPQVVAPKAVEASPDALNDPTAVPAELIQHIRERRPIR